MTDSRDFADADRPNPLDTWGSRSATVAATLIGVPAVAASLISMLVR